MKSIAILALFAALAVSQSSTTATAPALTNPLPAGQAPSTCLTDCVAGAFQSQIALSLPNPCINGTLSDGFSQCIIGEKCPEATLAPSWLSICQFVSAELRVPLAPAIASSPPNATQIIPNLDGTSATATKAITTASTTAVPVSSVAGLGVGFITVITAWVMLL